MRNKIKNAFVGIILPSILIHFGLATNPCFQELQGYGYEVGTYLSDFDLLSNSTEITKFHQISSITYCQENHNFQSTGTITSLQATVSAYWLEKWQDPINLNLIGRIPSKDDVCTQWKLLPGEQILEISVSYDPLDSKAPIKRVGLMSKNGQYLISGASKGSQTATWEFDEKNQPIGFYNFYYSNMQKFGVVNSNTSCDPNPGKEPFTPSNPVDSEKPIEDSKPEPQPGVYNDTNQQPEGQNDTAPTQPKMNNDTIQPEQQKDLKAFPVLEAKSATDSNLIYYIVGAVVGGLVIIAIIVIIYCRLNKKKADHSQNVDNTPIELQITKLGTNIDNREKQLQKKRHDVDLQLAEDTISANDLESPTIFVQSFTLELGGTPRMNQGGSGLNDGFMLQFVDCINQDVWKKILRPTQIFSTGIVNLNQPQDECLDESVTISNQTNQTKIEDQPSTTMINSDQDTGIKIPNVFQTHLELTSNEFQDLTN